MKNSAWENAWLTVQGEVFLTPIIEPVIILLDDFFAEAMRKATVTSGLRDAEQQLKIIQVLSYQHNIVGDFSEIEDASVDARREFSLREGEGFELLYEWQRAWSRLLELGVIVNPPLSARCLYPYMRDGENRQGKVIGPSPHFLGSSFDIGGGKNGVHDEVAIMAKAVEQKVPGLKGYLVERKNNAVHVDCCRV